MQLVRHTDNVSLPVEDAVWENARIPAFRNHRCWCFTPGARRGSSGSFEVGDRLEHCFAGRGALELNRVQQRHDERRDPADRSGPQFGFDFRWTFSQIDDIGLCLE